MIGGMNIVDRTHQHFLSSSRSQYKFCTIYTSIFRDIDVRYTWIKVGLSIYRITHDICIDTLKLFSWTDIKIVYAGQYYSQFGSIQVWPVRTNKITPRYNFHLRMTWPVHEANEAAASLQIQKDQWRTKGRGQGS